MSGATTSISSAKVGRSAEVTEVIRSRGKVHLRDGGNFVSEFSCFAAIYPLMVEDESSLKPLEVASVCPGASLVQNGCFLQTA